MAQLENRQEASPGKGRTKFEQSKPGRLEQSRLRFLTFRDKLFSLANVDEHVKQLWYTHGEKVRLAHPTAEKKVLLCLIVKAVWRAAHEDCKLYTQIWNHTPWFASRRTQPAAAQNRHRAPLEAAGDSALLRISSAKLQVEQVATTAGQLLAPNTSQAEMHALPAASVLGKRARHIDADPTEQETLRMIAKLSHHDVRRLLVRSARESKDVRAAIKAQHDAAVEGTADSSQERQASNGSGLLQCAALRVNDVTEETSSVGSLIEARFRSTPRCLSRLPS